MTNEDDVVHLRNNTKRWQLWETADAKLTDGIVSEDLQRDRIRQIAQWLRHYPERLPEMEALTRDGQRALERARAREREHNKWRRW